MAWKWFLTLKSLCRKYDMEMVFDLKKKIDVVVVVVIMILLKNDNYQVKNVRH